MDEQYERFLRNTFEMGRLHDEMSRDHYFIQEVKRQYNLSAGSIAGALENALKNDVVSVVLTGIREHDLLAVGNEDILSIPYAQYAGISKLSGEKVCGEFPMCRLNPKNHTHSRERR